MRADAQHNRERLLAVARKMARGGEPPSLNELAHRAGVGVATVYRHFPDVAALLAVLMEQPLAQLAELFEQARREPQPELSLRRLFLGVLELQQNNPLVARLVHAPDSTSAAVQHVLQQMQSTADEIVRTARRAKVVRASLRGSDVCQLLLGVHAAASAGQDPVALGRKYAEIVLAGMREPARLPRA
jgi:AcrR family transcriptional regulator